MPSEPSTGLPSASSRAKPLLTLGLLAGPLYVMVGVAQMLTREGFDMRRHALSLMSNGEYGWVQVANFLISGALVVAGAIGCRLALRYQPAGTWGPILLAVYGFGLLGAGIFTADPVEGFPPGSAGVDGISRHGLLHFVFGGLGFYAIIAACFVFARHFFRRKSSGMAWFSILTGLAFFASFMAIASGTTEPAVMIVFYIAVALIWAWFTVVLYRVVHTVA